MKASQKYSSKEIYQWLLELWKKNPTAEIGDLLYLKGYLSRDGKTYLENKKQT